MTQVAVPLFVAESTCPGGQPKLASLSTQTGLPLVIPAITCPGEQDVTETPGVGSTQWTSLFCHFRTQPSAHSGLPLEFMGGNNCPAFAGTAMIRRASSAQSPVESLTRGNDSNIWLLLIVWPDVITYADQF